MKRGIRAIFSVLLLLLTSCSSNGSSLINDGQRLAAAGQAGKQLHAYDSPYTLCYQNLDATYSLYVFAAPIQYDTGKGYTFIDNTLISSQRLPFAFENKANRIKCYFPPVLSEDCLIESEEDTLRFRPLFDVSSFSRGQQVEMANQYGDTVHGILYQSPSTDILLYATKAGIRWEFILKQEPAEHFFQFRVQSSAPELENRRNGYISFQKDAVKSALVYAPLISCGKKITTDSELSYCKDGDAVEITLMLPDELFSSGSDAYPIRLDPSFELYQNKMPDTSVYSEFNTNSFLRQYAIVGQHPQLGEGWEYLRLRINHFFSLKKDSILQATYHTKSLYETPETDLSLRLDSVNQDWSSTNMVWDDRILPKAQTVCPVINRLYTFDITDFVNEAVNDVDGFKESNGLVMRAEDNGEGYAILATSDNSVYTPYIEIRLSREPYAFIPRENINEI